ncbi:parafibromin-like [Symsagittifera roscoffensis]|uniref:parafibromin-like n=1 Tax=Symsagittifera roscoffensis TaxID=84072 RepID=UPI00307CB9B8
MADCLSVLREYRMTKKPIKVEDDLVIFGDKAWPKDTKTNYIRYDANSGQEDYYTLFSLVDFLDNINLPHHHYVKESSSKQIPVVRLPDRKDLENYLQGITSSSTRIDRTAPIQIAIPRGEKRPLGSSNRGIDAKKLKQDSSSKSRQDDDGSGAGSGAPVSSLTEAIPQEKLQELIKKRKAVIMKSTKPVISDDFVAPPNLVENRLGMSAEEAIKYITSKERVWRTRSTILQSTGSKLIGQNVGLILQSVRAIEGGGGASSKTEQKEDQLKEKQNQPTHYNRYDQEKFKGREDTEGFKIDTMGTYHGLSLKSVNQGSNNSSNSRPSSQSASYSHSSSSRSPSSAPQKRVSKTPIIILPGGSSSLISIFNAKDILQDLRFVSSEQKRQEGTRRDAEVLLHRSKAIGGQSVSVPYRVVDLPSKLTMEEWDRVVACFVQGPAWQFKGWPWLAPDGSPTEIFLHMKAFYMQWDDLPIDKNVQKWDVHILKLSRNHRHLDRAVILKFWEALDKWVGKHKPNLRT